MSLIQYISVTHTTKEEAKANKSMCNRTHNIYCKDATFNEICDIHDSGSTFGRIGKVTDFIVIDVDETSINIHKIFEYYKDNPDVHVCYSSSMSQLKYHILINMHKEITDKQYPYVVHAEFKKLKDAVCGRADYMKLDKKAANFYQCFFGECVQESLPFVLDNSQHILGWVKKDAEPVGYIETFNYRQRPSLNSADYCFKHGLLGINEDKRFDVMLPSMSRGRVKKIAEGHRYSWCRLTGTRILMRIFYLRDVFDEPWSKQDFLDTFEWAVKTNIVKPDEFCETADYRSLVNWLDNKWSILVDKSFEQKCDELDEYFKNRSKRNYRSRKYTPSVCQAIITEHLSGSDVVFEDKQELINLCVENDISYRAFTNYLNIHRFNLVFVTETKSKRKNCLDGFEVIDGILNISKSDLTSAIKSYCSRNKIKIQLHSSAY